jgi:hypothetical protein
MKTTVLYILLACAACSFIGWRVYSSKHQPVQHALILADLSLSHTEGCESLVGLTEQVLQADGIPADTKLTLLVVGDPTTANEPWRLGEYSIPRSRRITEGRNAIVNRREKLQRDIATKCAAARRASISPIYLGIHRAIAELRAQGCSKNSACRLYVGSDMEENVEASMQQFLNRSKGELTGTLPPRLHNEGIAVSICGLAGRAGRIVDPSGREVRKVTPNDAARDDRIHRAWLILFSSPDFVKFAPYCPKPR